MTLLRLYGNNEKNKYPFTFRTDTVKKMQSANFGWVFEVKMAFLANARGEFETNKIFVVLFKNKKK